MKLYSAFLCSGISEHLPPSYTCTLKNFQILPSTEIRISKVLDFIKLFENVCFLLACALMNRLQSEFTF